MSSFVLSIIGMIVGAIIRFIPEIFKYLTDLSNKKHEFKMTKLKLEKSQQNIEPEIISKSPEIKENLDVSIDEIKEDNNENLENNDKLYNDIIKNTNNISKNKWIDILNSSVRPFVTYWWMFIFTIHKFSIIIYSFCITTPAIYMIDRIWTENDYGILSAILSFWFVDRTIRKNKNN